MRDVSRETQEKLREFAALVRKWSPTINLVSKATLPDLEERHINDSRQLGDMAKGGQIWCDLGSGAGFPGIVLAILRADLQLRLVEADHRKATFLETVVRQLDLNCSVIRSRIEVAPEQAADTVSARALAPLRKLLDLSVRHGTAHTRYVFPKGERFKEELSEARRDWRFDVDVRPSRTEKKAVILILENIARV